jgi:hypothetical protein
MSKKCVRAAVHVLAALLVCACQPATQLQKQDQAIKGLKAQWINDWVRDHPCPPGPEINLDSLCRLYRPGNTDSASSADSAIVSKASFVDTTAKKDSVNRHRQTGGWSWVPPSNPVRILVPYEDTRTINLLNDSLASKMRQLIALQAGTKVATQDCSAEVAAAKQSGNKWIWLFIASCLLNLIFIILWVKSFLTSPVKSIL